MKLVQSRYVNVFGRIVPLVNPKPFGFGRSFVAYLTPPEEKGAGGEGGEGAGEGAPSPDEWQTKYAAEAAQSKKYRQRAQAAEQQLTALQQQQADQAQRLAELEELAHKRDTDQLVDKGQFSEALKKEQEKLNKQLDAARAAAKADQDKVTQRLSRVQDRLRRLQVLEPLTSALAKKGVKSDRLGVAMKVLQPRFRVDFDEEDSPIVNVLDEQGNVIADPAGAAGQSISIDQFVEQWAASPEGQMFLPASGDTGSGAHGGGAGAGQEGAALLARLDGDAQAKAAFIREKGQDAYLDLVRIHGTNRYKK
ncbi:MAG: hypothetical protein ABFD92_16805 [Planctomycetaceae bacterium]|nr:hypothetical protein [Planctomycetaceae bacterium]